MSDPETDGPRDGRGLCVFAVLQKRCDAARVRFAHGKARTAHVGCGNARTFRGELSSAFDFVGGDDAIGVAHLFPPITAQNRTARTR